MYLFYIIYIYLIMNTYIDQMNMFISLFIHKCLYVSYIYIYAHIYIFYFRSYIYTYMSLSPSLERLKIEQFVFVVRVLERGLSEPSTIPFCI